MCLFSFSRNIRSFLRLVIILASLVMVKAVEEGSLYVFSGYHSYMCHYISIMSVCLVFHHEAQTL